MAQINRTEAFYCSENPSLLWELTICQSLATADSAYARALEKPAAYGSRVASFISKHTDLAEQADEIIEVGGGYGSLMAGLLQVVSPRRLTMVDISHFLLQQQQKTLRHQVADFICQDIFAFLPTVRRPVDLLIANEIIGDFPTATNIDRQELAPHLTHGSTCAAAPPETLATLEGEALLAEVGRLITTYNLAIDDLPARFNLNLGALAFVEQLGKTGIQRAFITEHGADTELPYPFSVQLQTYDRQDKNPRQIRLKDHDEYTIRFDHLDAVARIAGFQIQRFHLMEMLEVRFDDEINYLLTTGRPTSEAQEILLEFYDHVAEYQGLLLTRK
ncbi:MAG: SAM-dependent methyltransferase [Deltaproteobacteria bacterium]|nr:SAM-dependent methyltransferase [Candidatus Anaeroferrophillus wilburensis]MBN2888809.1 SAM-dependent methyltransferase [Deltaproteobacteria bacterium]